MASTVNLPHFFLSWALPERTVSVGKFVPPRLPLAPGLDVRWDAYRPTPYIQEREEHFLWVLGNPILGERIDKAGAARGFLAAGDVPAYLRGLNGEFLIIHWNKREGRLRIANDRFASIPCYHAAISQGFVASVWYNDLWRLLRQLPGFRVRGEAVFEFMYLQRVLGSKTHDNYSRFLPAATLLTFDGGRTTYERYWHPDYRKERSWTVADFSGELAERLKASFRRKTSDGARPGLFLSGGMDTRTVLAAAEPPPLCFTVGFSENHEVQVARRAAALKGAEHHYLKVPEDYYVRYLSELIALCGAMYVYDHALFLGLENEIQSRVDVIFHGYAFDQLFQGMWMPTRRYRILGHQSLVRRLRRVGPDIAEDYLASIHHRLKYVDLFRYVRPSQRSQIWEALHGSASAVIAEGRRYTDDPYDLWDYFITHAMSRHFTNTNVSSMGANAEQRTLSFDNDIFALSCSIPAQVRFAAKVLRGALRMLNPLLAKLESGNTGLKIDSSPMELELLHLLRYLKRLATGNPAYRHPRAEDRTWPYRDDYLRAAPELIDHIRKACRSEVLADALPFLDMDALRQDVEHWLGRPRGGGDLMATLLTVDLFLKQE